MGTGTCFSCQNVTPGYLQSYGNLSRAAKELGVNKSTLSRWMNSEHVSDEIVVAAREIGGEVRQTLTEHTQDLASKVLREIESRFDQDMYSSYELIMLFGIVSDKHVNFKKMSSLDEAKNVEVHWPTITPMSATEIEDERSRIKLEHEERSNQVE